MKRSYDITLNLPPWLHKWVKAQASESAIDTAAWVQQALAMMSKGRGPEQARVEHEMFAHSLGVGPSPFVPPTPESELDAIVGGKLEDYPEAETHEAATMAAVTPLHRPPTPFSPTNQPKHLAGL